ncbi:MAG: nicotinate-nucleotide--dimethylbenzimidazole phosphoribosyltransferase, partial [Atribacterota bacterium]|nr:nicotinate-nucleotide--dimethylbenzimidazole phosphoribosyltransferase [Atribacterota bacterium]
MRNKKIEKIIQKIMPVNKDLEEITIKKFDNLTKPAKSLGELEKIIALAAGVYGTLNPSLKRKVVFLMAADHGVTVEKISAYPAEITRQMVLNFLNGGAAINILTEHFGIEVAITDIGVKGEFADIKELKGLNKRKIAHGTSNMVNGPAMTPEMAEKSILTGYEVFEESYS